MLMRFSIHPTLLIGNLRAARRFLAADDARLHYACIMLEQHPARDVARFVATDGCTLWINEEWVKPATKEATTLKAPSSRVLIISSDVDTTLKKLDRKGVMVDVESDGHQVRFEQGKEKWSHPNQVKAGPSPYAKVLPDPTLFPKSDDERGRAVHVNAKYVTRTCEAFTDISAARDDHNKVKPKERHEVYFTWHAGRDHLEPTIAISSRAPDALVIIMPANLDEVHPAHLLKRYREG